MSEGPISLSGLVCGVELAVNVRDKEEARGWYANKLGIVFDETDRAHVCGITLVLWGFRDAVPASHVVYQLITPNLERAHMLLTERGVAVSPIDEHNWNFLVSDPEGNKFAFYTPQLWRTSGMAPYHGAMPLDSDGARPLRHNQRQPSLEHGQTMSTVTSRPDKPPVEPLTRRERQILALLAQGSPRRGSPNSSRWQSARSSGTCNICTASYGSTTVSAPSSAPPSWASFAFRAPRSSSPTPNITCCWVIHCWNDVSRG